MKQPFKLEEPFLVLATQNPIEQEGTYPLPEAQVDRFMLKVVINYPKKEEEKLILRQNITNTFPKTNTVLKTEDILKARELSAKCIWMKKLKNTLLILSFHPGTRKNTN